MIRACFLVHSAAPSGAELATLRLLSALRRPGHRRIDTVLCYTEGGPMVRRTRDLGIETWVVRGPFDSRTLTIDGADVRGLLRACLGLLRTGWTLGAAVRDGGATVIVAQSTKALAMGAIAARRARVPLIWQVHDRVSAEYFGRGLARAIRGFGWLVADGYLVNSYSTLASLSTWRRRHAVAYPGVESGGAAGEQRSAQRPAAQTVLVVLGRLTPWKGQHVLLRALAEVRTRPREVYLVGGTFFGEESYRAELARLAVALDIPVRFTGHVDDPGEYLRRADILVHCSVLAEPFGQVVVEGMRAGCAVIATRPGGPEEIIEPERSGLLVDGGDQAGLTRALDRLIGDRALRERLSAAAVARAARFDIAETATVVAGFLDGVRGAHAR
ncbi:glycosyltransferase family 4 protein [Nocardia sp. NPDC052566]|uniref:glycosyltransferase family 4 protein n=1 Tax=Nocardia sp. NPDC052566 TaxID=3364330 RepID=UPI0037C76FDF